MLIREETSYSDLRDEFDAQFARLSRAKSPGFVVRAGKPIAVVMSPKQFEAYAAAKDREEARQALEESLRQSDAGETIPWEQAKRRLKAAAKRSSKARSRRTR